MIKLFNKTSSPRVFNLLSWHPNDSVTWVLIISLIKQPVKKPKWVRWYHVREHNTGGELDLWLPFVPYTIDIQWQRKIKR